MSLARIEDRGITNWNWRSNFLMSVMSAGLNSIDVLLRPSEVARRLAVSRATVYRWFWEEKLSGVKLGEGHNDPVRIYESSVKNRESIFADEVPENCSHDEQQLLKLAYAKFLVAWG
jgi:excisionase family DNA binding protein